MRARANTIARWSTTMLRCGSTRRDCRHLRHRASSTRQRRGRPERRGLGETVSLRPAETMSILGHALRSASKKQEGNKAIAESSRYALARSGCLLAYRPQWKEIAKGDNVRGGEFGSRAAGRVEPSTPADSCNSCCRGKWRKTRRRFPSRACGIHEAVAIRLGRAVPLLVEKLIGHDRLPSSPPSNRTSRPPAALRSKRRRLRLHRRGEIRRSALGAVIGLRCSRRFRGTAESNT